MSDDIKFLFAFWGGIVCMFYVVILGFLLSEVHQIKKDINKIKEHVNGNY